MNLHIPHQYVRYVAFGVFTALIVVGFLLFSNLGVINILSYFTKEDPYKNSIILFYGDGCSQCETVSKYLADNAVSQKVAFVELEVFDNIENRNMLSGKAQICGIDVHQIGVPFVWESAQHRCVIGYVDVIEFFKEKVKLAKNL